MWRRLGAQPYWLCSTFSLSKRDRFFHLLLRPTRVITPLVIFRTGHQLRYGSSNNCKDASDFSEMGEEGSSEEAPCCPEDAPLCTEAAVSFLTEDFDVTPRGVSDSAEASLAGASALIQKQAAWPSFPAASHPWVPRADRSAAEVQRNKEAAHKKLTQLFRDDMLRCQVHEKPGVYYSTGDSRSLYDRSVKISSFSEQPSLYPPGGSGSVASSDEGSRTCAAPMQGKTTTAAGGALTGNLMESSGAEEDELARATQAVPPLKRAAKHCFHLDEDEEPVQGLARPPSPVADVPDTLEVLEQELLDDNYVYFPLSAPAPTHGKDGQQRTRGEEDTALEVATYVPGQQIIPPGYTRYRVDVQYQGSDFDGWFKSSTAQWYRHERLPDGTMRRVPVPATEISPNARPNPNYNYSMGVDAEGADGVAQGGMHTLYHARTVLQDALAVALDVPAVTVVAAVIPEAGVTVRRLTCHFDAPSELELQPRTIIQRATMWLQKRRQPLAILCCHQCANQDFHARHTGVRRVYCYRILNRVAPPLFDAGLQWHVDRHLDVARMQRFAAAMEGTQDYGYFADPKMANALRRTAASTGGFATAPYSAEHAEPTVLDLNPHEVAPAPKLPVDRGLTNLERAAALPTFNVHGQRVLSYNAKPKEYFKARTNLPTVRTVEKIHVVRQEDEVLMWFVGKSFLRHQIRNMVSVLKASGHGLWDERELQHAFASGFEVSRKRFKRERLPPAPAYGLTLWEVEYPREHRDDYVPFVDSGPYEEVDISTLH